MRNSFRPTMVWKSSLPRIFMSATAPSRWLPKASAFWCEGREGRSC